MLSPKMTKIGIGAAVALVSFMISYKVASATETKSTSDTIKNKPEQTTGKETIDLSTVRGVQRGLVILGYDVGATGVDDSYGPATSKAVASFSSANGGPNSGTINTALRKLLASKLKEKGYNITGDTASVTVGRMISSINQYIKIESKKNTVLATVNKNVVGRKLGFV